MTQQLRDELERIAGSAPRVDLPSDAWARGRAAHRRDLAARVGAVVVVVGLIGSLLGWGLVTRPDRVEPAEPSDSAPALPYQVWDVPDHLVRFAGDGVFRWAYGVGRADLRVGRASLAFLTGDGSTDGGGLPMVVTTDGAYHPLELPGFTGATFGAAVGRASTMLALSPDGTHLAWAFGAPATGREDYTPVPSGIKVTDLTTGETTTTALRRLGDPDAQAVLAHRLTWSPDGRVLGWQATQQRQYNGSGSGTGGLPRIAGRIEVASGRLTALPRGGRRDLLAVADDGTLLFRERNGRLGSWGSTGATGRDDIEETDQAAFLSPDGSHLALGYVFNQGAALNIADVRTGRVRARPLSGDVYSGDVTARPVGWVDEQHLMAVVTTTDDQTYGTGSHLALLTPPSVPAERWTYRVLTRIENGVDVTSLTVATTGLDLADPTSETPEPDWPWSTERRVWTGVLTALGALGLVLLAGLLWRRTRPAR